MLCKLKNFSGCKVKNLFPEDTRIVELTSAIAMMAACVPELYGMNISHMNVPAWQIWLMAGAMISAIQFGALVLFDKIEALRVYASLAMGGLLVYLGALHAGETSAFSYMTQITLGIANLYAFLVNNQRLVWK